MSEIDGDWTWGELATFAEGVAQERDKLRAEIRKAEEARDSWRVAYGEKQALLVVFEAALIEIARGAPDGAAIAKRILAESFPPVTDPSQPPAG